MSSADSPEQVYFALYRYTPSVPAAAVFVAVFVALSVWHGVLLLRHRALFFVPFIIGLLFEAAGYAARIFSHYDTLALGPYIVQTMLILVAPPLFAASIYMTLGRLIVNLGAEKASIIRVKYITKIFVVGDVISFLLQCGGGGYMAAGSLSAMEIGEQIVIAGLAVQLAFFGFFIIASAVFHSRVRAKPAVHAAGARHRLCARLQLVGGDAVVSGNDGYIMKREYLLYIFDAVLMAVQAILLLLVYPGKIVTGAPRAGDIALNSRENSSDGILPRDARKHEPC
ncbi:RTA1 like protein-domain-containing protein [Aspergillus granulosus]|uniref:RTA1 like protein-domain-containing protein n=1 Tax=Aspergillus granulosus TaxID=176169 RepID=A0ABR4GRT5_9EURO